ncbi:hypothetical protein ACTTAI_16360 [Rhodobacter capsulatus]|uniref:hypothetical protein n=1 Tax=Rhodobacter capsulatus TaxID=1061 RepID=UPI004027CC5E
MALSFPYPLEFLSADLRMASIPLTLRRFDEKSGSADGRFWSAQMAAPLWSAVVPLVTRTSVAAREIDAKIIALGGMAKTFLWSDPSYAPAGGGAPGTGVTLSEISQDRTSVALAGLPAGYHIAVGDRLSISYSGRVWMATFSEARTANGSGAVASTAVYPYVPLSVDIGASVEMAVPYFRAMVESYTGFVAVPGKISRSATLTLLQKP